MLTHISPSRGPRRNKDTGDAGKSTCKFVIKLKINKKYAILSWPHTRIYTYHHPFKDHYQFEDRQSISDFIMRPHTKINTYHHRLKENPAPTPLVHDPPTQKIGWNLNAQV